MAIMEGHKANLETLKNAFLSDRVCLMECTDTKTNEKVAIICAINIEDNEYAMVPMAMMPNENPYERFIPPKGDD